MKNVLRISQCVKFKSIYPQEAKRSFYPELFFFNFHFRKLSKMAFDVYLKLLLTLFGIKILQTNKNENNKRKKLLTGLANVPRAAS